MQHKKYKQNQHVLTKPVNMTFHSKGSHHLSKKFLVLIKGFWLNHISVKEDLEIEASFS